MPFDPRNGKTQRIRILDVILIGPVMIYGGLELQKSHPILGPVLSLFGIATIVYNGRNYLRIREERR
jgi:hypothetical protein